jgi:hypothetical protein
MHNTDARDQQNSDELNINPLLRYSQIFLVIFNCQGFINADIHRLYNPDKILKNSIFISFIKLNTCSIA